VPRKKATAKRRGRPKYNDEPILLEMARASLTGSYPSDYAIAKAFASRVDGASEGAKTKRLYERFRKDREKLIQKVQESGEDP
jgi:hypothetical protein